MRALDTFVETPPTAKVPSSSLKRCWLVRGVAGGGGPKMQA